jgi:hypothetical protein
LLAALLLVTFLSSLRFRHSNTAAQLVFSASRLHSEVLSNHSAQLLTAPVSYEAAAVRLAANQGGNIDSSSHDSAVQGSSSGESSETAPRDGVNGSAWVGAGGSRDIPLQHIRDSNITSAQQQQQRENFSGLIASSMVPQPGGKMTSSNVSSPSLTSSSNSTDAVAEKGGSSSPLSSSSSSLTLNTNKSDSSELTAYTNNVLLPVLTAATRAQEDLTYIQKLQEAARQPINIAVMTTLMFDFPKDTTKGCQVDGIPLDCRIHNGGTEVSCHI